MYVILIFQAIGARWCVVYVEDNALTHYKNEKLHVKESSNSVLNLVF